MTPPSSTSASTSTLHVLGDHGQTIDGSANDVRGRQVTDTNGQTIGTVADLLVDDAADKVRFLLVEHGGFLGFGHTTSLIPVDAITQVSPDDVRIDQTRERIAAAPGYAPALVDDRPYQASVYDHYGHVPYWGMGYLYPLLPQFSPPPVSP